MSFREIAALMRRHVLAVLVVLILAVIVGYNIKSTPMVYSESGTVVFTATTSAASSNSSVSVGQSLIVTETMLARTLQSGPMRDEVRDAGGTGQYEFTPFNAYNMEYPDYAEPVTALTTRSRSLAAARRTFRAALRVLSRRLAAIQAQADVAHRDRIQAYLTADVGPVATPGSRMRAFAGLVVLTAVAVLMVLSCLDRRRRWSGSTVLFR